MNFVPRVFTLKTELTVRFGHGRDRKENRARRLCVERGNTNGCRGIELTFYQESTHLLVANDVYLVCGFPDAAFSRLA